MKKVLPLLSAIVLSFTAYSQSASIKWQAKFESQKVFIENKGQFNNLNSTGGSPVLFATDNAAAQIIFTKRGLTYRLQKSIKKEKEEREHEKKQSFE